MTNRKTRASGRLLLSDVAALAGVSKMTASRALRGTGQVSPELVAKIKVAAERLNYIPDQAAKALASSRSAFVGVLIPTVTNTVFADLLEAAHRVLFPEHIQVLIGNTHYSLEQEELLMRHFLAYRPSGLIITGFNQSSETRKMIKASGTPCVHVMELSDDSSVYCVGLSHFLAAQEAVTYLVSRGRRRIAFVGAQNDPRNLQRREGYRTVLVNHGIHDIALESNVSQPTSVELGGNLFRELIKRRPDIDAVFCSNDDLAQGAMFEALRLGIRVPEDVAVIGFNDVEQSAHSVPRMTTMHTPRSEIGTQAAKMLIELIRGSTVPQRSVDVGFELIIRESA